MSLSGHQSARMKSDTWLTPPIWIAKLGPFDLDPCCPEQMPWRTAERMLTKATDGLKAEWRGRVWLNPPFGKQAAKWMERMAMHRNGIALVPARTETEMFVRNVWGGAVGICFVHGRPHFHDELGERAPFNSGAPIALVAYSAHDVEILRQSHLGTTLVIA